MSDFYFILDQMRASGFPFPEYIRFDPKTAENESSEETPSYHSTELKLVGRANVWLSAVKLACLALQPLKKKLLTKKVADAAFRYGIENDVEQALTTVRNLQTKTAGIATLSDYGRGKDWLFENADQLDQDIRIRLADHLLDQAVKLGHVPSLLEKYRLDEIAGRDPETGDVHRFAKKNLHKLANGSVFRTDQFGVLPITEIEEYLPRLLKTASLEMNVVEPHRLGKIAATLPEHEADVLESLMLRYNQDPVFCDRDNPIEISDTDLAEL